MRLSKILMWAQVHAACDKGVKVAVFTGSDGVYGEIEVRGVARYVMRAQHDGLAFDWTDKCRLRVTGHLEYFIPLGDIQEFYILPEGAE